MAKDPAVLFYTSDFLSGTQYFTDEQCGQYIRLLCQQHQLGHIPEQHMINICKTHDSPVFTKFIKDDVGLWYNERMDKEKQKRAEYCNSRKLNRLHKKEETHEEHMLDHMSVHMENENDNDNINDIKNKNKKHKYGEFKNVLLADDEVLKLKERFPDYEKRIENMSSGIAMKGYKYKSHYLAILKWAEKDPPKPSSDSSYEATMQFLKEMKKG